VITLRGIGRGFLAVIFVIFLFFTIAGFFIDYLAGLFFGFITILILIVIARTTKSSQFEKKILEEILVSLEVSKKELNDAEKKITELGLKKEKFLGIKKKIDQMIRDVEAFQEAQDECSKITNEELDKLKERLEGKSKKRFKEKVKQIEKFASEGNAKEFREKLEEVEAEFDADLNKSKDKIETVLIILEKITINDEVLTKEVESLIKDIENKEEDIKNSAIVSESDLQDGFLRYSWREMEDLTGKLFKKKGYSVEVTQGSVDFGIDVWAEKDGITTGIQVKKWNSDVGFDDVTKTLGSNLGKANKYILISTTSFFTPQAWEHQRQHSHLIELWDTDRFRKELRDNFIKIPYSKPPATFVKDDKIDSFDFDKGFNLDEVYDQSDDSLKEDKKCTKCGATVFTNFCGNCGKEFENS